MTRLLIVANDIATARQVGPALEAAGGFRATQAANIAEAITRGTLEPSQYAAVVVVTAQPIIDRSPVLVDSFVAALAKADAAVKADPAGAEQVVLANLHGMMPPADMHAIWAATDTTTRLDPALLALVADEANWIVDRGMVKADKPTAAELAAFVDAAPLRKVLPGNVALP